MYQYRVYTNDRQVLEGSIDAATEAAAEASLLAAGHRRVLTLKPVSSAFSFGDIQARFRKVDKPDIIDFFHQLATLLDAGLPFTQALNILAEQAAKPGLKEIIGGIGAAVAGGGSFSGALERCPKLVAAHYRQVIKVSEKSGNLAAGLKMVAGYMEKENSTGARVKRMLAYPAFLGLMSLIVIIVVATVAVPSLVKLFESLNVALPLPTRGLIAVAGFITHYKFHVLAGLAALILVVLVLLRQPGVKRFIDAVSLKLPVIGNIIIMRNVCRFCRASAMLIEAGLTLPQALDTIIGTTDSETVRNALADIRQEVVKGKGLAGALARAGLFPRLLVDMAGIGEKTGTLAAAFTTAADYYEKRLDARVQRLLGMIEPASIIIAGCVIALIGVAIITPMYSIYHTVH